MARTGRPRGFDRDAAVQQAMRLFWEHGYEATSLTQIKAAAGISTSSFFAAFRSKEALFGEALDCYLRTHGNVTAPLRDPDLPPRRAVQQALRGSARMQTDDAHPLGCLVVLSTTTCSLESRHVQARLAGERQRNRDGLLACVQRAIDRGELRADTDAASLAAVFDTFLVGLAIEARDKVSLTALDAAVSAVMGVWDAHATNQPTH